MLQSADRFEDDQLPPTLVFIPVTETARFFLLLGLATSLAAVAILAVRSEAAAGHAARAFFWICVIPSTAVLLERAAAALGIGPSGRLVDGAFLPIRWAVLGIAAASAVLSVTAPARAPFPRSAWTRRGLCAFTALAYLATEAGKLAHDVEMREFFTASGYPIWAMYAVMAAEVAGAIGLLVPRLRLPAAAGLSLLMLGAIGTHARNGDPFSDSLDAVRMLVLLGAIAALARPPRMPGNEAGRLPLRDARDHRSAGERDRPPIRNRT